jgi:hypothetical protein
VLCSRIIRTHPLPDGNKRVGYVAALELVARNDAAWTPPPDDEEGDTLSASSNHWPPASPAKKRSPAGSTNASTDKPPSWAGRYALTGAA